jgi:hypothetical protein
MMGRRMHDFSKIFEPRAGLFGSKVIEVIKMYDKEGENI